MKKIYLTSIAIAFSILNTTRADTWAMPVEADYYSDNNMFVAHVTPSQNETKAKLEVSRITGVQKHLMWTCALGNEDAPREVFITNDGNYVATVNEWGRRRHGGWGDFVVAFYGINGLIKNYSLEQIFHYPERIDKNSFEKLFASSTSGRHWTYYPMFFDLSGDTLYFCVWLRYGKQWLAWDIVTGNEADIAPDLQARWNEKGRTWALREGLNKPVFKQIAYEFLAEIKNPDDRDIFEDLLKNGTYSTSGITRLESKSLMRVYDLRCSSKARKMADDFLSDLDGQPIGVGDFNSQAYNYLGVIKGEFHLPKFPENINSCLCLYLIPKDVPVENWRVSEGLISTCKAFGRLEYSNTLPATLPSREMPFFFEGITPGEYRVKAVWYQTKRYEWSCDCAKHPPKTGDYESPPSAIFEVKAGEKTSGIIIECTREITNEPD